MISRLPALFIGHGNPMNALQDNDVTRGWRTIAGRMPKPRSILVISAHWLTRGVAVTAMDRPATLHDFDGFPQDLADFQYPAPGDPVLANRVAELLSPTPVAPDTSWGLDHGAWSILVHLVPQADIPVVQLSLDIRQTPAWHLALGRQLRPLREEGVLILASGNVVHHLGKMNWRRPVACFDWADRFNARIRMALAAGQQETLLDLNDPDARLAVPTPEHYLPLLYVAALAEPGDPLHFFNDRIQYGSIGMLSFSVGLAP